MPCADYTESNLQTAFNVRCTGNTELTNIFVSSFQKELIHAAVYFLGSCHNSSNVWSSELLLGRSSTDKTLRGYARKTMRLSLERALHIERYYVIERRVKRMTYRSLPILQRLMQFCHELWLPNDKALNWMCVRWKRCLKNWYCHSQYVRLSGSFSYKFLCTCTIWGRGIWVLTTYKYYTERKIPVSS